jgi:hypothetical protein
MSRLVTRRVELRTPAARSTGPVLVVVLAAAVVATILGSSAAWAAPADPDQDRHPRATAEEVCEPMVHESVIAAAGRPLARPRRGKWDGNSRYTCTYSFGSRGSVVATVDVLADPAAARRAYATERSAVPDRVTLFGLGQRAFRDRQTRIVAQKDRFLLSVDGTSLARSVHPSSTTWSTTRAIFDCW